jgi:hypothetical protein
MKENGGYFLHCVDQNVDQDEQRNNQLSLVFPTLLALLSLSNFTLFVRCITLLFVA